MDAADIAATLQMQFAGQLVLYVPDMAKIFGKSEKAVTSLISRDGLPFKVKFLGSRQCVDIFQVAVWLASTNGAAEEVTQSTSAIESMPTRKSSRKSTKGSPVAVANLDSTLMTPMAQALLAMRHDRAEDIEHYAARFVGDEKDFLLGVAQAVSGRGPRYRVTVAVGDISDRISKLTSIPALGSLIILHRARSTNSSSDCCAGMKSDIVNCPARSLTTIGGTPRKRAARLENCPDTWFTSRTPERS